jgi:HAD superfamily hydrolase (TIGR01509 family)
VAKIQLLLFDLGGVLVDFSGPRELGQYLRTPASPEEILKRWVACPHTDAFEMGRLAPRGWAQRFVRDWDVALEPGDFLQKFTTWSRCMLPGAQELLAELRPQYRLAALSNSNELHWERNTNELRVIELFEFAISSHQVGLCKPNPDIFRVALDRAKLPADAVMFFDDLAANVAAAASVGIAARQVKGVDALRGTLVAEGLLSA